MANSETPIISSRAALMFQASIAVVALGAIGLFGIEVDTRGVSVVSAILIGTVGGVATYLLLLLLTKVPGVFPPSALKQHSRDLFVFASGHSWPTLIGLAALAGLGEELLFRAVIQGWLAAQTNVYVGVVAGAVLFGLAHWLSVTYFLVATMLGVLLGTVYAVSESILLAMVWHGVYDLTALVFLRQFPQLFGIDDGA